jgi:Thioredoxin like C-terminal domain
MRDPEKIHIVPGSVAITSGVWPDAVTSIGSWTIGRQAAVLDDANGKIVYRFHARDLNLVMAPSVLGTPVRFRLFIVYLSDMRCGVVKDHCYRTRHVDRRVPNDSWLSLAVDALKQFQNVFANFSTVFGIGLKGLSHHHLVRQRDCQRPYLVALRTFIDGTVPSLMALER